MLLPSYSRNIHVVEAYRAYLYSINYTERCIYFCYIFLKDVVSYRAMLNEFSMLLYHRILLIKLIVIHCQRVENIKINKFLRAKALISFDPRIFKFLHRYGFVRINALYQRNVKGYFKF